MFAPPDGVMKLSCDHVHLIALESFVVNNVARSMACTTTGNNAGIESLKQGK